MHLGQSTLEEASLGGVGRQSDRLAVGGGRLPIPAETGRSPHVRRVSTTRASVASEGWQHFSDRRGSGGGRGRIAIAVGAPGYVTLPPP